MRPETIEFTNGIPVKAYVRGGCQYPFHWHDTLEILWVLKGSVNIGIGDENLLLHENDIALINLGELHRITKTQEDNEILFLQIDEGFCRSVLPDNEFLYFYFCSISRDSTSNELRAPEKYAAVKEHMARLLQAITEKPNAEHKKNIENILTDMLSYISYHFDYLRWGYGTEPFNDKLVTRLRQIAEQAISDLEVQLKLKDLADEAGISLWHLSHDIKEKFGLTFIELLYYSKCAYASKLLLSTDGRIIDIALECGFSDTKYFVKYFRKYFNVSPSAFRTMHQADSRTLSAQAEYRECPFANALNQIS